jgi:hypothetical protein
MFMQFLVAGVDAPTDCEFPFAISQQEHEILNHEGSVIICGRSGTGKVNDFGGCFSYQVVTNECYLIDILQCLPPAC